uniref:DDE Tnp4 domain-containing protein n=1 Tax=Salvator merianae TaxID=96440 RepID=A0A8D0E4K9_SALMN
MTSGLGFFCKYPEIPGRSIRSCSSAASLALVEVGYSDIFKYRFCSFCNMEPHVLLQLLKWYLEVLVAVLQSTITQCNAYLLSVRRRQRRRLLISQAIHDHILRTRRIVHRRKSTGHLIPILGFLENRSVLRRWWVCPTEQHWWEQSMLKNWDDEGWIENFRMSRGTLFEIAEMLRPQLQRQRTVMREAISVEKRVAMAVWWLSNLKCYREVAMQFGVGRSTVGQVVLEVCFAITHLLGCQTIYLDDYKKIMDGFRKMGFPHCVGVLDAIHVPVTSSTGQAEELGDHKASHSVQLQGTTDHTGQFIDIELGWSGRNHDEFIFYNSALYQAMDKGTFVPGNPTITIQNVQIPPLILGNNAYPMRRWLMKPYMGSLDHRKAIYNRVFNNCHSVITQAFSRLKARWRRLTTRLPVAEENVGAVITACVVLHNICEKKGHAVPDGFDVPEYVLSPEYNEEYCFNENCDESEGEEVRNALSHFLAKNNEC